MKPLIPPTINLNSNTADDLLERLRHVLHNINHLKQSMVDASDVIHGRNFQTVTDPINTRRAADDAWRERWTMIDHYEDDIRQLAIAISDQKHEREQRIKKDWTDITS